MRFAALNVFTWQEYIYYLDIPTSAIDGLFTKLLVQNQSDAQKALSKNGMQINGVLIIGVKPVDPIQRQALNERLHNQGFLPIPPLLSSRNLESNGFNVTPHPYSLRNGSSIARQSGGTVAVPAKSAMSKIMDLIYGVWFKFLFLPLFLLCVFYLCWRFYSDNSCVTALCAKPLDAAVEVYKLCFF